MKKICGLVFSLLTILLLSFPQSLVEAAPPANFQSNQVIGSGLDVPSGFDFAPDGRIFILERTGAVRIYKGGQLLPDPFVTLPSTASGDRGLIGIAFDPGFNSNHWVYFYYTGTDTLNRLVRYDASGDTASGLSVLIYQTTTASNLLHVGGTVRFGADGKLYLSIGDNGYGPNSQDLSNPFGKILRLNPDGTIPTDNPYVGQSGKLGEIWANGFRNPFRFQFDSVTGRLYEGDVGQDSWEEINLVQRGLNYGWPTCEGTCTNTNFINPIYTYSHAGQSSAVAGGMVYQGNMFPASFKGNYFFGDYARGFIKWLSLDSNGNSTGVNDFDLNAGSVVDMKTASDGSLYYLTYIPGRLYRITYSTGNQIPVANATADKTKGLDPLTVKFSSAGSYDPDGTNLTYLWDFGDGTTSTTPNPTKVYDNKGTYTVELTVSDGVNFSQAVPIVIQVGTPPNVILASPSEGSTYKAGDTISYAASGTDAAGFDLPDDAFTTEVLLHHDTHIHPFLGPLKSKSGQFTIPTTGEPSASTWYEVKVTGTDSNNLSTTKTANIFPIKVDLTFATVPSGLQVLIDGVPTPAPQTIKHVVGFQRTLSVPVVQEAGGKVYQFASWSDNGSIQHNIVAPTNPTTYTANFTLAPSFTAQYFSNKNLAGTPTLTRQDAKIDFDWAGGSPDPSLPPDNFSVRWSKQQSFAAGKYLFVTTTDDGVRLFVDNQLVIDNWGDQSKTSYQTTLDLAQGNHTITMEYYDGGGSAFARLFWDVAPEQGTTPIVDGPGLRGDYFNNIDFTSPTISRVDQNINFNWGSGSPDPTMGADTFSARWTGSITPPTSETYTFYTATDDGVRLWVNNQLLVDKWVNQGGTEWSGSIPLTAGVKYSIKMEYFENSGGAGAQLAWSSPSTSKQIIPQSVLYSSSVVTPPALTASCIGAPNPALTGGQVSWGASVTGGTPNYSYSWSGTDTLSGTSQNINKTYSTVGTKNAAVVVTDANNKTVTANCSVIVNAPSYPEFKGEYWNTPGKTSAPTFPTSAADLTRNDIAVNFDWGGRSPDPLITNDHFAARWTKTASFEAATYRFTATADDGVRVYIDNQLVIDSWIDQGATTYTGDKAMTAGNHDLKIEYYENAGGAVAKFSYAKVAAPPPVNGLKADYFDNIDFTAPVLSRTDPTVDFNWGNGSPDLVIGIDTFSVRWTGVIQPQYSQTYTFYTSSDDGVRLWVNNQLLIDKWVNQSTKEWSGQIVLAAGQKYMIKLEYFDSSGSAVVHLRWSSPSQPKQIIPQSRLFTQ